MGVSIHYRGRLNDLGQIAKLCDELADIAEAMGWKATALDDDWEQPANVRLENAPEGVRIDGHLGLKGIQIAPDGEVESLSFFFDREGILRDKMEYLGRKIDEIAGRLSSARLGDVSGLSAEEIARRIERLLSDE